MRAMRARSASRYDPSVLTDTERRVYGAFWRWREERPNATPSRYRVLLEAGTDLTPADYAAFANLVHCGLIPPCPIGESEEPEPRPEEQAAFAARTAVVREAKLAKGRVSRDSDCAFPSLSTAELNAVLPT